MRRWSAGELVKISRVCLHYSGADTNCRPRSSAFGARSRLGAFPISAPMNPSVHRGDKGGELLNVRKGFADCREPTVEAGTFNRRICYPLEAPSFVTALELD
jgi:hypothetical protein